MKILGRYYVKDKVYQICIPFKLRVIEFEFDSNAVDQDDDESYFQTLISHKTIYNNGGSHNGSQGMKDI